MLFFIEIVFKSFFFSGEILLLCIDYLLAGQFVQKLGTILLGNFITHKRQESLKFGQHHGSIFIFVVQFAQLNIVMVVTSVFWLLDSLLDKGYNLIELAEF